MGLGCSVGELLSRVGSRELAEWRAYEVLEPWGGPRQDANAAVIACTIANVHRRKGRPPYKLKDFAIRWGDPPRRQGLDEMLAVAEAANAAMGGKDLRGKSGNDSNPAS